MKLTVFISVFFCLFMFAQQDSEEKQDTKIAQPDTMQSEVQPGEYVYQPKGRRDPFWNLLRGREMENRKRRKGGLAGLTIDQLTLEGIISSKGEYTALLSGPDSKPYSVKVGDSVFDGDIIKIDNQSVVFKKILTVALGGKKERIIIKQLNPEEEGKIN